MSTHAFIPAADTSAALIILKPGVSGAPLQLARKDASHQCLLTTAAGYGFLKNIREVVMLFPGTCELENHSLH